MNIRGTILAQETTTLPEGAQISVIRVLTQSDVRGKISTKLIAARMDDEVVMQADNISPGNCKTYLEMTVKEIDKIREKLLAANMKPLPNPHPRTLEEFVGQMILKEMFIKTALSENV